MARSHQRSTPIKHVGPYGPYAGKKSHLKSPTRFKPGFSSGGPGAVRTPATRPSTTSAQSSQIHAAQQQRGINSNPFQPAPVQHIQPTLSPNHPAMQPQIQHHAPAPQHTPPGANVLPQPQH